MLEIQAWISKINVISKVLKGRLHILSWWVIITRTRAAPRSSGSNYIPGNEGRDMGLPFKLSKLSHEVWELKICNISTIHTSIFSFPAFLYTCCLETLNVAVNLSSVCRGSFLTPTKLRTKCVKEFKSSKQSSLSHFIFAFPQRSNIFLLL